MVAKINYMAAQPARSIKSRKPRVMLSIYNRNSEEYIAYILTLDEARKMIDGLTKALSKIEDEDSNVLA